eukprot:365920-Chlamydomonas_euryale.AAC.6
MVETQGLGHLGQGRAAAATPCLVLRWPSSRRDAALRRDWAGRQPQHAGGQRGSGCTAGGLPQPPQAAGQADKPPQSRPRPEAPTQSPCARRDRSRGARCVAPRRFLSVSVMRFTAVSGRQALRPPACRGCAAVAQPHELHASAT